MCCLRLATLECRKSLAAKGYTLANAHEIKHEKPQKHAKTRAKLHGSTPLCSGDYCRNCTLRNSELRHSYPLRPPKQDLVSLSTRGLSHFEFQHPLMAPCRTLVVPWCVGIFLQLRIGLGVRRTWRKLEKTCSTFKLQCRKGDTIQDLWELEFFISCAFLGIRIPSSMWEQRCGNRQGSKAAVYSRYNKN